MIIYLSVSEQLNYISLFYFVSPFIFRHRLYLPPATKLEQGYAFTHVCDYVHRGCLPHTPGQTPPWADALSPRQTPPWAHIPLGRHTPWADSPPRADTPPGRQPPRQTTPPVHAGIRILMECNLVRITIPLCFKNIYDLLQNMYNKTQISVTIR